MSKEDEAIAKSLAEKEQRRKDRLKPGWKPFDGALEPLDKTVDVLVATSTKVVPGKASPEIVNLRTEDESWTGPESLARRILRLEQLVYFMLNAKVNTYAPNKITQPESARVFTELLADLRKDVINNG